MAEGKTRKEVTKMKMNKLDDSSNCKTMCIRRRKSSRSWLKGDPE